MLNALQINQKIYTLSTFRRAIDETLKIRFRKSASRFCIQNLPEYSSSALPVHAYKMVITTVCVQIDNVSVIRDLLSISVRR